MNKQEIHDLLAEVTGGAPQYDRGDHIIINVMSNRAAEIVAGALKYMRNVLAIVDIGSTYVTIPFDSDGNTLKP